MGYTTKFLNHYALATRRCGQAAHRYSFNSFNSFNPFNRINCSTWFLLSIGLAALASASAATNPPVATSSASATNVSIPLITLRGKVVCLPEEMHQLYEAPLPTNHEHVYGFKTVEGRFYTLLRNHYSEALFADQRFREK